MLDVLLLRLRDKPELEPYKSLKERVLLLLMETSHKNFLCAVDDGLKGLDFAP
jgi:hypothetical protein